MPPISSAPGGTIIVGDAPSPIVFEGGEGDDKIVIVGSAKGGVLVRGGGGRDSITLESHWSWLAHHIGMPGFVILGTATIMLAVVLTICWRALQQER